MFGNRKKLEELDQEVSVYKKQMETAAQEKHELMSKLKSAEDRIKDLEEQLKDNDLKKLKKKAKQSAVEFEGLKELYTEKIREFEETRETKEEEFAKESAIKRNDLLEEIQENRENNQQIIKNTVNDFAGSYLYYMDQIRMLMDALTQAAAETGSTLFKAEGGDVKQRFGASIAEHLKNDVRALEQSRGDRLLIDAVDKEETEESDEEEVEPEEFTVEEAAPEEAEDDEELDPDDD
jgi:hypothetical protein